MIAIATPIFWFGLGTAYITMAIQKASNYESFKRPLGENA
jgi:hypothetical protein